MARENILVVEDERDIQELVRYNLTKEGYTVQCVGTGEEALRGRAVGAAGPGGAGPDAARTGRPGGLPQAQGRGRDRAHPRSSC